MAYTYTNYGVLSNTSLQLMEIDERDSCLMYGDENEDVGVVMRDLIDAVRWGNL